MTHQVHDIASLEMATRVARGLSGHPEWIDLAKSNLDRWSRRNSESPSLLACYEEWRQILQRPVEEISAILTAETDEGQRLRQNSPFAAVLSPAEVWQIKRQAHEATGRALVAIAGTISYRPDYDYKKLRARKND